MGLTKLVHVLVSAVVACMFVGACGLTTPAPSDAELEALIDSVKSNARKSSRANAGGNPAESEYDQLRESFVKHKQVWQRHGAEYFLRHNIPRHWTTSAHICFVCFLADNDIKKARAVLDRIRIPLTSAQVWSEFDSSQETTLLGLLSREVAGSTDSSFQSAWRSVRNRMHVGDLENSIYLVVPLDLIE